MAIWQLHYAFINDDVRVQFYFIRVLKLASLGGFTTCYNFIRVSSNNPIKMSGVFHTSYEQTHNRDHTCSAFYGVPETSAKFGLHAGDTKFNTQREKLTSMGLCITICTILSVNFFYTSWWNKKCNKFDLRSYREIDVKTSNVCVVLLITRGIASRDIMTVDRT